MLTLLIISLFLHGVTILWIFVLMKRIDLANSTKHEGEKLKREIEQLLLSYTAEMKEENEKLIRALEQKNEKEQLEQKNEEEEKVEEGAEVERETSERPYTLPLLDDESGSIDYTVSETARVLALADKGLQADEIAKTLNIGVGEVELLLKFHGDSKKGREQT